MTKMNTYKERKSHSLGAAVNKGNSIGANDSYYSKITILWIAFTISGTAIVAIAAIYSGHVINLLLENPVVFIAYVLSYIAWKKFRFHSRSEIRNAPDFELRFKSDISFAKRFNNTEIVKTLISYILFSVPIIYVTGISERFIGYFGIASGGFASDLQHLVFSSVASIFNLAFGILCSYVYDKIKNKLP